MFNYIIIIIIIIIIITITEIFIKDLAKSFESIPKAEWTI